MKAKKKLKEIDQRERLVMLLYVLLRDAVPIAKLSRIVFDVKDTVRHAGSVRYSDARIESLAREMAVSVTTAALLGSDSILTTREVTR